MVCELLGVPAADVDQATLASQAMTHGGAGQAYAAMAVLEGLPAGAPVLIDIEGTSTDPARFHRPVHL